MARKRLAILAAASTCLVVAGASYASIPDSNGLIHGCFKSATGDLRVIDPTSPKKDEASCKKTETALNWNQTGQQGPKGDAGPAGPAGPQGPAGFQGPAGPAGPQGPAGPKGDKGDDGAAGPAGPAGPQGQTGTQGPAGQQGPQGQSGPQGPAGPAGPQGSAGTTGQDVATVLGTASLHVSGPGSFTLVPGLTQGVSVPSNAKVYLASHGDVFCDSSAPGEGSAVEVAIFLDGVLEFRQLVIAEASTVPGYANWSLSGAVPVSPGFHSFEVRAHWLGGDPADVSGSSDSFLQGALTVLFLKQ